MDKPREFYIHFDGGDVIVEAAADLYMKSEETVVVVEKSAYDKAVAALRYYWDIDYDQMVEDGTADRILKELGEI